MNHNELFPDVEPTLHSGNKPNMIMLYFPLIYCVGQKFHSCFSLRCAGKTQTNFLANPIYC